MIKTCIYSFYDRKGIVDDSAVIMLTHLKQEFDYIVIVTMGEYASESIDKLKQFSDKVIAIENTTSFGEGYRRGFLSIDRSILQRSELLALCNSNLIGPLFPVASLYQSMDSADCDFWGLVKHYQSMSSPYPHRKLGGIPEHVQSSFLVFKQTVLKGGSLESFFKNMPFLSEEEETLGGFTVRINSYLEEKGYIPFAFIDDVFFKGVCGNPYLFKSFALVKEHKLPFIEKTPFYADLTSKIEKTTNVEQRRLLTYLDENNLYSTSVLWKNLLRNHHLYHLKNNLNLNYVFCDQQERNSVTGSLKMALFLHIYYIDLLPICFSYIENLPDGVDIWITTDSEEKKQGILSAAFNVQIKVKDVILVKNRGRDVSALLVGSRKQILNYDLVCFIHDKKSIHHNSGIVGEDFFQRCLRSLLNSKSHVDSIISQFNTNPRLGILMPSLPGFSYYKLYGKGWDRNFDIVKSLFELLKLDVPLSETVPPIGPFGSMFWFRPQSIEQILNYNWVYDNFPPEPLDFDGTISHGIERIYPFIAQQNGYYSSYVMTDEYASADLTNSYFVLNKINRILFDKFLITDFNLLVHTLKAMKSRKFLLYDLFREQQINAKKMLKKLFPYSLFIFLVKLKRLIFGPRSLKGFYDDGE
ncbi:MAG: hypothetical protein JEY91_17350 [Spirochaetaceae bacterium]|nr:hypothetical protein [Spirochaetaceae bacterium]